MCVCVCVCVYEGDEEMNLFWKVSGSKMGGQHYQPKEELQN